MSRGEYESTPSEQVERSIAASPASTTPASSDIEVELKLAGDPKTLEKLWETRFKSAGPGETKDLESTYYDTADGRLRRRGLTLRVRKDGRRYIQTVKAAGSDTAGIMTRGEWSSPVATAKPDLRKITDQEIRERIGLILPAELAPVFMTRVTRRIKKVRTSGRRLPKAVVEVALDSGEVVANGTRQAISELELELVEGAPQALYDLALEAMGDAPMQIQTDSKARRGFALAHGETATWHKAAQVAFATDTSLDGAIETIFRACAEHWLANHTAVLHSDHPEGVHQMRVALRRMRSAISVLKDALPPEHSEWLNTEAKWLIGNLGPARDWDVFIAELLQPLIDARPDDGDLLALKEAAEDEQRLGYERARGALLSARYTRFVLDLGGWLESKGWRVNGTAAGLDQPLIGLADGLLQRRHKKTLKLGKHFERLSDEERHRVRIALKKLRYTAEFFVSLYPKKQTQPYLLALKHLQDDLGFLNDVAVAQGLLQNLLESKHGDNIGALRYGAGLVVGWHAHNLAQRRPHIEASWREFAAAHAFWHKPEHRH